MTHTYSQPRRRFGICTVLLWCLSVLVFPAASIRAQVQDSVVVVGGRYQPAEALVTIGVRIVNADALSRISVPLEIRSITPGAFITSLNMTFSERLAVPGVLPDDIRTYQYETPTGTVCKYGAPSFTDGATHPVAASPEGVWFHRLAGAPSNYLPAGIDPVGTASIYLGVDLTDVAGTFEIDTMCVDPGAPGNKLAFSTDDAGTFSPAFAKGRIEIQGPPDARDTSITVRGEETFIGTLIASDPNLTDALTFTLLVPPSGNLDLDPSGSFAYTAPSLPGSDFFEFEVSDGLDSDIGVVTITILPPVADTFFVRTNGDDATGTGTSANPFGTINYAISVAGSNDVIIVGPGSYSGPEQIPLTFPYSKSLKVFSEQGPFATELLGTPSASGSVVIMDVGSAGYEVTLEGFTIRDNQVIDASSDFRAGGITVVTPTKANIIGCIIKNNIGLDDAGGIQYRGRDGMIANNWIANNHGGLAPGSVGGVSIYPLANVTFAHNTVVGNSGPDGSGVAGVRIDGESSVERLDNNIFAFNSPGAGLRSVSPILTKTYYNNLYFGSSSDPVGFEPFTGWIFGDPLFKAVDFGDYHLTCASPARTTGRFASVPSGLPRDIDRQLRTTLSLQVDMGADQYYDTEKQAIFTPTVDSGCAPLTVTFANQSLCIDEQWRWDFGNGQTSTIKSPTIQFTSPGSYSVRLIALGSLDADTTFRTIKVIAPVNANFSAVATTGCVPFQVGFTATSNANAGTVEYVWDFGDGQIGSGQAVSHTYTTAAKRTVTLIATGLCGADTVEKFEYIDAQTNPVIEMISSFDTVVGAPCNPFAVQFGYTSDRKILSWNWDFGDDQTSTDSLPLHVYAEGDTFSVRLIAAGACGSDTVVRSGYIKLTPRPIVIATASPPFACQSQTQVSFNGTVAGAYSDALWLFGDGGSAPGLMATHVYGAVGRYLPKFVVTSQCGQDTIAVPDSITVGSQPDAMFVVSADTGYDPHTVQFTNTSLNLPSTFLWRFGDNSTSTLTNPSRTYAAGVYDASLIAGNPCGVDTSANTRIVVGSYKAEILDSIGQSGDTILYSVLIDSLVIGYDHTVYLSGRSTPLPIQGTIGITFAPASGVPPFTSIMKVVPSLNLSTGNYALEVRAVDSLRMNTQGTPVTKTASRILSHIGFTAMQITPDPLTMDSTIVSTVTSRILTIRNISTSQEPYTLIVQPAQISGPPMEIIPNQGNGATLAPGQALVWTIGFRPTRKGDFSGWVRVRSNDPGQPDVQVNIFGRGIGEQVPPRVSVASPANNSEATIDRNVTLTFSEQMIVAPLDTVLRVTSKRANAIVPGTGQMTQTSLTFQPSEWFWPDDTITVTVKAVITDTNGNRLDGNGDGFESGPPTDDYRLTFFTGPGVFPGDANHDGFVNEADILPLGRFWLIQGPPRSQPYTSFSVQPSRAFPTRIAAHADCDGNGIIDSADICPIIEFFDRDTVLPKAVVESWLSETSTWSASVVDALLGALLNCQTQGAGAEILRELLTQAQSQNPLPTNYALEQNYPNPFNSATVISYSLASPGDVTLEVFDILGRKVATLTDDLRAAGHHRVIWDGQDQDGRELATGVYFYRLRTDDFVQSRKMLLLK